MTVINTNISALIAHQTLARNDRDMSQAMTRLSTGLRINSAGDDAAGLAIATRMTAQMQGLDQAVRNANDAVSMIQTADGASIELGNIIQRMRVLAVQAISDTYTETDRKALNAEFAGLQEQLEIIATQTEWNGSPLMTGDIGKDGTSTFHIGANAEQSMEITFGDWTSAGRGVYRNGASTPNNIGPTDLLETPTQREVKPVSAVYTSAMTNNDALASLGNMVLSDGTNTMTVDARSVTDRASLVAKIQATPGYSDMLFTVSDNGGSNVFGSPAVYTTSMTDQEVAGFGEEFKITDGSGNTITISATDMKNTNTVAALVTKIQAASGFGNLDLLVSKSDDTANGGSTGLRLTMKNVGAPGQDPLVAHNEVDRNVIVTTPFANAAPEGLSLKYKEAGAVASPPTVTLNQMNGSGAVVGDFVVDITELEIEHAGDLPGSKAFTVSDGVTTLRIDDVSNLVYPGADGDTAGNVAKLAKAIQALPDYDNLTFTVAMSGTNVDQMAFTYKTPGFVQTSARPTVEFGRVAPQTAQFKFAPVTGKAENLIVGDGVTTVTVASTATTSVAAMATAIQGGTGYANLKYTVAAVGSDLVFTAKYAGVPGNASDINAGAPNAIVTFTQSVSTNPTRVDVRAGTTEINQNYPRTVSVGTSAGSDGAPTPTLTVQGVNGRPEVASTPFTPSIDILTSGNAKSALDNLLQALDGINMQRATYGAAINRLEHTMDNLMQMSSNAAATRGRIQDADYAKESTELARTQIVQQASTAMLTQANASAQSVLALLKS